MKTKQHQEENIAVLLKAIISAHKNLRDDIEKQYPELSGIQLNTVLLIRIGYTNKEIKIMLGIDDDEITEAKMII